MGLWDLITNQFIDVIEWLSDDDDIMVYRFERDDNEIKFGAMLTVRESQMAVFVNEGQIADVFPPGLYQLETANLPILSDLQAWPHGFNSPFKAEVYFINAHQFTDLKWGTKKPLMMRDTEFGAIRLRAFGTYTIKISDPATFLREIAGTDGYFTTSEVTDQLRNIILSRFADITANSNIPVLDMAANFGKLGKFLSKTINPEFEAYGLTLTKLLVESISLPDEVEAALDKRTSIGMVKNLDEYLQYQAGGALGNAGNGQSSGSNGMAAGVGMGMGMAMAEKLGKTFNSPPTSKGPIPPPIPSETHSYFLVVDDKRAGPYDSHELLDQVLNGALKKSTLVWREGMRKWRKASELDELRPVWNALPPPIKTA
ncbi:MAG: SPFH domain-containing protein [Arenicellales bacterium]